MTKFSSAAFKVFLIDGFNMLGAKPKAFTKKVINGVQNKTHGLGDEWAESSATGIRSAEITQSGAFFEDAANGMHEAWKGLTQVVRILTVGMLGNAIGSPMTGVQGVYAGSYEVMGKDEALTEANAGYVVSGQIDDGVIVQDWTEKTADWNTKTDGQSIDNGASSANGGVGYLNVSDFAGFTGFVGKIRHSDDDTTYSDLITFDNLTAQGAQRIEVAGTIKRYLCFDGNVTGTGSLTPFAGFKRN